MTHTQKRGGDRSLESLEWIRFLQEDRNEEAKKKGEEVKKNWNDFLFFFNIMAGLFRLGPFVSLTELFLIPPPYFFFFTCTIWNLAIGFFLEITSSLVVTRPSFPNTQCVGIKTGMKAEQTHTPIKSVCVWGGGE